jgi:tRNA threonylcarbamoyladenosine biosynthesis protein TsaB
MSLILCIETATTVCSVALANDESIIAFKETRIKNSHAEVVTVFIQELLSENGIEFSDLGAVAVSKGPGSYTGLRIGVSTAKGLCYALNLPLIAIPTLEVLTAGIIKDYKTADDQFVLFCPMIDARRMEVYSALYNSDLEQVREIKAEIIEKESFAEYLKKGSVVFLGDGSLKCKGIINHLNAIYSGHLYPSATHMVLLASKSFQKLQYEDVAYFEPFYLKDFIPGVPKVKGLQ